MFDCLEYRLCCYWDISIHSIGCIWVYSCCCAAFMITTRTRPCFRCLNPSSAYHQKRTDRQECYGSQKNALVIHPFKIRSTLLIKVGNSVDCQITVRWLFFDLLTTVLMSCCQVQYNLILFWLFQRAQSYPFQAWAPVINQMRLLLVLIKV